MKLIYDDESDKRAESALKIYSLVTVPSTPEPAELQVRRIRKHLEHYFSALIEIKNSASVKCEAIEACGNDFLKKYSAPNEPFLPGALAIPISGMAGLLISEKRPLIARIFMPPTLSIAAACVALPGISANLACAGVKKLEDYKTAKELITNCKIAYNRAEREWRSLANQIPDGFFGIRS